MTKRENDFHVGKVRRDATSADLNLVLEMHNTGMRFERKQSYLKTMGVVELTKNNTVKNSLIQSTYGKAMYIHYVLTKKKQSKPSIIYFYV
jgi:hypothetical protein